MKKILVGLTICIIAVSLFIKAEAHNTRKETLKKITWKKRSAMKRTDWMCVSDCTSQGYQYGYCVSECSWYTRY